VNRKFYQINLRRERRKLTSLEKIKPDGQNVLVFATKSNFQRIKKNIFPVHHTHTKRKDTTKRSIIRREKKKSFAHLFLATSNDDRDLRFVEKKKK